MSLHPFPKSPCHYGQLGAYNSLQMNNSVKNFHCVLKCHGQAHTLKLQLWLVASHSLQWRKPKISARPVRVSHTTT